MFHSIIHSFLDHRWSLYSKFETDLHELRYIFWESTRVCNLNCLHCGSDCTSDSSVRGLSEQIVLKVFDEIARTWDSQKIMVVITGGEPLVRRDLFEITSKIKAMGFRIGMVTNGYSLDKSVALKIRESGLESMVVSLDGPEEIHDWLRNRKGSFKRSMDAIANLVEVKIPIVEAITCVTPRTVEHIEETYEIVKNSGAGYWRVFNIFPIGRAKDNTDVLLEETQFKKLAEKMILLREKGKKEGLVVNLSEEGWLGWDYENKLRDTPYFCRAGINIAGIMADGTISACPNLPSNFSQGNINVDSFVNVWENRYSLFRDRDWMKKGMCSDCKHFSVCKGNSLHLWDPEKNEPAWCHYKILHD